MRKEKCSTRIQVKRNHSPDTDNAYKCIIPKCDCCEEFSTVSITFEKPKDGIKGGAKKKTTKIYLCDEHINSFVDIMRYFSG